MRTGSIGIVILDLTRRNRRSIYCRTSSSCKGAGPIARAAIPGRPTPAGSPAIRWSVSSSSRSRIRGSVAADIQRRLEDQPRSRLDGQRLGFRSSRGPPGSLQFSCGVASRRFRTSASGSREGGGDEETRTPDLLLAKEMLYQLSYVPLASAGVVVGVSGLEPETSALSGQCSNQLS